MRLVGWWALALAAGAQAVLHRLDARGVHPRLRRRDSRGSFGGLGGVFMNPASPTEFVDNSLHIHIHQTFREGVTLEKITQERF